MSVSFVPNISDRAISSSSNITNNEIINRNWKGILGLITFLGLYIVTRKKVCNARVKQTLKFGTVAATSKVMRQIYLNSIISQNQMPSPLLRYKERKEHDLLTKYIRWIERNEQDIIKKEKTSSCPIHKCALWTAKVFATLPIACISACASTKVFGYIGSIYGHVDERSASSELKVEKESKRYFASLWVIGPAASYSVLSALDGPSVHYFHQETTQPRSLTIILDDSNPFNDILNDLDELDSFTQKRRVIFVSTANKNFLEVLGANHEQALSHFGTLKEAFKRHQVDNVFFKGCFFSSHGVSKGKSIAELFISTFGEVSEITFEDCIFENTNLLKQENIRNKYKLLGPRLIVQQTTPPQEPNGITVLYDSKDLAEGFAGKLKGEIEIFLNPQTLMHSQLCFNLIKHKKLG